MSSDDVGLALVIDGELSLQGRVKAAPAAQVVFNSAGRCNITCIVV